MNIIASPRGEIISIRHPVVFTNYHPIREAIRRNGCYYYPTKSEFWDKMQRSVIIREPHQEDYPEYY